MRNLVEFGQLIIPAQRGISIVYRRPDALAIAQNGDRRAIEDEIARLNSPEIARQTFREEGLIAAFSLPHTNEEIVLKKPSGPYTEDADLLLVCGPLTFTKGSDGLIPLHNSYDVKYVTTQARVLYDSFELELLGLKHERTRHPDVALVAENLIAATSTEAIPTSRSYRGPHKHIGTVLDKSIQRGEPPFAPHVAKEQQLFANKRVTEMLIADLVSEIEGVSLEEVSIGRRTVPPFGYQIRYPVIDFGDERMLTYVSEVRQAHYDALKKVTDGMVPPFLRHYEATERTTLAELGVHRSQLIPQPSVRRITYVDDQGRINDCFVPAVFSAAGPFETMGILLDRNPKHPRLWEAGAIQNRRTEDLVYMANKLG